MKKQTKTKTKSNKTNKFSKTLDLYNVVNSAVITSDGHQPVMTRGEPPIKFVDVTTAGASPSATGSILAGFCNITQGPGVSQRTGDTIFYRNCYINYILYTTNSDVTTSTRVIIFQWHPNSNLVVPIVSDILQTASIYSMYDWQYSNQYTILYDRIHFASGTATAPCDSSAQGYFGGINIGKAVQRAEFAPASALGSEQLYCLVISDSAIAPFPVFSITSRVVYTDE